MSKADIRNELTLALANFAGTVTICPPAPNGKPVSKAKESRKKFRESYEPNIRPRQNWDTIAVPHESRLYKGYRDCKAN